MGVRTSSIDGLVRDLGSSRVLRTEADLAAYAYDGALDRGWPDAVVLAREASEVARAVSWCSHERVPFVARGAGTNLSGGCIPVRGGLVLSLAPMTRILQIDTERGAAVVEPGAVNLRLQKASEPLGWFYPPDPASYRVCTLGGNIAENAGGPRCLKYGVTSNHVVAVEAVMPDGVVARFSIEDEGPDLVGLLVGSEGTLGVVTRAWLRLLRIPEGIQTMLAGFPSVREAVGCVSEIVSRGILPRVLEAMDRTTIESVEAYNHAGYPRTEAVLLIELDGPAERISEESRFVERLCRQHGASEVRRAADALEREKLWEGRRGAYAAVARIAPNVLVEDGVVPRGRLPEAYDRVEAVARDHRARVAMLFHAGDGNLHPNIAFDERDPEETRRVKKAGFEMLRVCVELGGSISGEHGIGLDKRAAMTWLFTPETLSLFRRIKRAFDPEGLANPDKLIPLPGEVAAVREVSAPRRTPSAGARGLIDLMRQAAVRKAWVSVMGSGTKLGATGHGWETSARLLEGEGMKISTQGISAILDLDRANYSITVEAGVEPTRLAQELRPMGFYAPLPMVSGTLGGLLAAKMWPGIRDHILGMRILLASGEVADLGGKVVKNVAGYDVSKVLLGSWGSLAVILEVILRLYPVPVEIPLSLPAPRPFAPNVWHRRLKSAFDPEGRLNPWVFGRG